jgi:hypothetical protein
MRLQIGMTEERSTVPVSLRLLNYESMRVLLSYSTEPAFIILTTYESRSVRPG